MLLFFQFLYVIVFSTSVSEQLEKESKEMEARLQQLQDKLQKQQLEDSSSGKSKWKSARVEKGGLGTYGKELEVKHKKKMESEGVNNDALLKGTASNRRTSRQATQGGNFKTKGELQFRRSSLVPNFL